MPETGESGQNSERMVSWDKDCCQQRTRGITSKRELPTINGLVETLMALDEHELVDWKALVRQTLETYAPNLIGEPMLALNYVGIVGNIIEGNKELLTDNALELLATVLYQAELLETVWKESGELDTTLDQAKASVWTIRELEIRE